MNLWRWCAALAGATALGCGLAPSGAEPADVLGVEQLAKDLKPAAPAVASNGQKIALVVGNAEYTHAPDLRRTLDDARLIHQTLTGLGFDAELLLNASKGRLTSELGRFQEQLQGGAVGFLYYSGHAVQIEGVNYLVPVDADLAHPRDADLQAVDARRVLKAMRQAGSQLNVVVLDACRNNPFVKGWPSAFKSAPGASGGLATMTAVEGDFLVAFATNPGNVAEDTGVYATALANELQRPCTNLPRAFARVKDQVKRATKGDGTSHVQTPWVNSNVGDAAFEFEPAGCPPPVVEGVASDAEPPKSPTSTVFAPRDPMPGQSWSSLGGIALRWVPGGTFTMGSPRMRTLVTTMRSSTRSPSRQGCG